MRYHEGRIQVGAGQTRPRRSSRRTLALLAAVAACGLSGALVAPAAAGPDAARMEVVRGEMPVRLRPSRPVDPAGPGADAAPPASDPMSGQHRRCAGPTEIFVVGYGDVEAIPNAIRLSLSVARTDADSARAVEAVRELDAVLRAELAAIGIDGQSMSPPTLGIRAEHVRGRATGWTAALSFEVDVADYAQLGALEQAIGGTDRARLSGALYVNTGRDAVAALARQRAVQDALTSARTLAEAADLRLGRIVALEGFAHEDMRSLGVLDHLRDHAAPEVPTTVDRHAGQGLLLDTLPKRERVAYEVAATFMAHCTEGVEAPETRWRDRRGGRALEESRARDVGALEGGGPGRHVVEGESPEQAQARWEAIREAWRRDNREQILRTLEHMQRFGEEAADVLDREGGRLREGMDMIRSRTPDEVRSWADFLRRAADHMEQRLADVPAAGSDDVGGGEAADVVPAHP